MTLTVNNSLPSAPNLKQFFSGGNHEAKWPEKYSLIKNISLWVSDIPNSVAQNIENSDITWLWQLITPLSVLQTWRFFYGGNHEPNES